MSRQHDEETDLMTRATLMARLEMVAEELEAAAERLAAVVEEIKEKNGIGGAGD